MISPCCRPALAAGFPSITPSTTYTDFLVTIVGHNAKRNFKRRTATHAAVFRSSEKRGRLFIHGAYYTINVVHDIFGTRIVDLLGIIRWFMIIGMRTRKEEQDGNAVVIKRRMIGRADTRSCPWKFSDWR